APAAANLLRRRGGWCGWWGAHTTTHTSSTLLAVGRCVILYLRFFRDMTQKRIGEVFGISQMQVSRLITRSCARVRAEALKEHPTDEAAA
ncbi:sigma factor-like helix-turn-helix DNA-binding protein, partial [Streptomyces fagopyri]|uniref:sigma factor-like helix-turn-helix DNA-binding protein n=1 Tax=Streptomyces fagopyri TaxID=2662397 RepID=UPI0036A41F66